MNFKKLIAGSTLALSLLGAYDVAKEMTQPNTMEAQAATAYWNKDKAKQLDQFMQRWQREMGQTYRKGYGISWREDAPMSEGTDGILYYKEGIGQRPVIGNPDYYRSMPLYPSSTGSRKNVYNMVARYYRSNYRYTMDSFRYVFTIYNGKPQVYMTAQTNGGFYDDYGNDLIFYTPTENKALQDGFARIVNQKPKQKEPKSKDCDRIISARGKVTLYKNKFATSKKGTTNDASTYRATSYYNYNGKMYYSVYQRDAKGKFTWKGYVEAKKMKTVKGTSINKDFVVTKGNYGVYRDLYRTKKVADSKKYLNKTVRIKKSYQLSDGRKYQEAYYKGKFIGFIGSGALKAK